ncbi:uncharacterized protein [Haliotis cracherodii]|uniref:uncharacterized protein LOC124115666 n=1 Tax=Haliotis rufescens TaxID=6454 RepID=UPI001EB05A89|nr:uncharacterized protein LOC124115666 [Haliotis rufescens]XP_046332684.1 uncharacterized protein LOC124115666 [Haliotis rufescens]XP_048239456.1 uncharacterized protein LOC124115666 [Haliotis rufescens]
MPADRRAALQLGLLLLAVPAQYFVSKFFSTPEAQRSQSVKILLSNALGFKNRYLSWNSWQKWCYELIGSLNKKKNVLFTGQDNPQGESPAVEVFKYRDPKGYFSQSTEPRSPRPANVKYRVGQVIRHKIWGYRGIIVGWDHQARAPESWIKQMHGKGKGHYRTQPNYSILVDTRDRISPQTTYVPQENLEVIVHMQVIHPDIDNYFENFDGAQYIARPFLKAIYPND